MFGQYPQKEPPCIHFQLKDTLLSHRQAKGQAQLVYAQAHPNVPSVPNIKKKKKIKSQTRF